MNRFTVSDLKLQYMEQPHSKSKKLAINYIGETFEYRKLNRSYYTIKNGTII